MGQTKRGRRKIEKVKTTPHHIPEDERREKKQKSKPNRKSGKWGIYIRRWVLDDFIKNRLIPISPLVTRVVLLICWRMRGDEGRTNSKRVSKQGNEGCNLILMRYFSSILIFCFTLVLLLIVLDFILATVCNPRYHVIRLFF